MNPVIIDNCVVSKYNEGIHICPIKLMKQNYPNINIHSLQKITYGNKTNDKYILSKLSSGSMKFDDLFT